MIAPYTNIMQTTIHVDIDVIDSALGDELVIPMNKLMSIKNKVISNAILPGTISCGMIKLICIGKLDKSVFPTLNWKMIIMNLIPKTLSQEGQMVRSN